jgi:hypothetical protein
MVWQVMLDQSLSRTDTLSVFVAISTEDFCPATSTERSTRVGGDVSFRTLTSFKGTFRLHPFFSFTLASL